MAPGIVLDFLAEEQKPIRVLDPMMGSGTVLAVAQSRGHFATGIDIDPLAVLISRVWTSPVDREAVRRKGKEVLERARTVFRDLPSRDAYPKGADEQTRKFVRFWFDPYARRQLASLSTAIGRVRDDQIRDALWCSFSRLIISKQSGASLAMDLSHSRPHKAFDRAPSKPFRKFLAAVDRVAENCPDIEAGSSRGATTYLADARTLPLDDESIDLVLTSPPYLNAIDYVRCSKFSLVWMGHEVGHLRQLRSESIGAELAYSGEDDREAIDIVSALKLRPALTPRHRTILIRYIRDMQSAVCEVARVLSPGGRAIYVVGENTIRGTFIKNALIVSLIAAQFGLVLSQRRTRVIPDSRRYLPPPRNQTGAASMNSRMRREVVLVFMKPILA
jgi:SAM-dependent methyltransferase